MTTTDNADMTTADNVVALPAAQSPKVEEAINLIVFGLDGADKPHASWFTADETPLAEKAAGMMGMRVLRMTETELQALTGKLPQGRVFESGKAFVPFVNRVLYDQLDALGGETPPQVEQPAPVGNKPARARLADDHANLAAGEVVLAADESPNSGWWEAVITDRQGPDLFVMHWEHWPEEPVIVRHRSQIALLPPVVAAAD